MTPVDMGVEMCRNSLCQGLEVEEYGRKVMC